MYVAGDHLQYVCYVCVYTGMFQILFHTTLGQDKKTRPKVWLFYELATGNRLWKAFRSALISPLRWLLKSLRFDFLFLFLFSDVLIRLREIIVFRHGTISVNSSKAQKKESQRALQPDISHHLTHWEKRDLQI